MHQQDCIANIIYIFGLPPWLCRMFSFEIKFHSVGFTKFKNKWSDDPNKTTSGLLMHVVQTDFNSVSDFIINPTSYFIFPGLL